LVVVALGEADSLERLGKQDKEDQEVVAFPAVLVDSRNGRHMVEALDMQLLFWKSSARLAALRGVQRQNGSA